MPRAVAINVGANTNDPGFRGPIYPDGSAEFVPIPEREPTGEDSPTYADLDLRCSIPDAVRDVPVHLDPEFAAYPHCERHTYGDPWGVKARPLLDLAAGDHVYFYATLTPHDADGDPDPSTADHPDWVTPEWGAYLLGRFELARDPLSGETFETLPPSDRAPFANNAHVRRESFDAAVLLLGTERSGLFDRAVPLSADRGTDANGIVTDLSSDSGRGPWWRRPLRFDADGAGALCDIVAGERDVPG